MHCRLLLAVTVATLCLKPNSPQQGFNNLEYFSKMTYNLLSTNKMKVKMLSAFFSLINTLLSQTEPIKSDFTTTRVTNGKFFKLTSASDSMLIIMIERKKKGIWVCLLYFHS